MKIKTETMDTSYVAEMEDVDYYLLQDIYFTLKSFSNNSYIVGGCVRDKLMGKKPKDYDIVTDAMLDKIAPVFKEGGWRVSETGRQFLVLSVSKRGKQYEIANFRKDGIYLDGRRPKSVEIGTLEEDAQRRDFTVNALYINLESLYNMGKGGEVVDPTERGVNDLYNRTLRFIGKPKERIKEDYLRVFRFYRFLRKGFTPDPKSMRAVREMFTEAYNKTTPERVRAELEKMI